MDARDLIIGGTLSRVSFGRTFVVLEGYSSVEGMTVEWWLRLGKEFWIRDIESDGTPAEIIDVYDSKLSAAPALIDSCDSSVAEFSAAENGLSLQMGRIQLKMEFGAGETGCAELDWKCSDQQGNPLETFTITLPDAL